MKQAGHLIAVPSWYVELLAKIKPHLTDEEAIEMKYFSDFFIEKIEERKISFVYWFRKKSSWAEKYKLNQLMSCFFVYRLKSKILWTKEHNGLFFTSTTRAF